MTAHRARPARRPPGGGGRLPHAGRRPGALPGGRRRGDQRRGSSTGGVAVPPGAGARVPGAALPGDDVSSRRSVMTLTVARQMIGAEILKLRRNRALDGVRARAHGRGHRAGVRLHRASSTHPIHCRTQPAGGVLGVQPRGAGAGTVLRDADGDADRRRGGHRRSSPAACSATWSPPAARGWRCSSCALPAAIIVTLCMQRGGLRCSCWSATFLFAGGIPTPEPRRRSSRARAGSRWATWSSRRWRSGVGSLTGSRARHADRGHRLAGHRHQDPVQRHLTGIGP